MTAPLDLSREQILSHRRSVTALDERLPPGRRSLRRAAWAGLQDSVPRSALLSMHARIEQTTPTGWKDESLVQVWGPRFCTYVVAAVDLPVFTLGRRSDRPVRRALGEDLADRLERLTGSTPVPMGEAARAIGAGHPSELRYAAPTGRVLIHWDGARQPHVWTVPRPDMDAEVARLELLRRFLHVLGPAGEEGYAAWAGVRPAPAAASFEALRLSLVPVRTPLAQQWILAEDEDSFRQAVGSPAAARLLPSGDTFYLLWGEDRNLLVADDEQRAELWTSRVWPGAVLVDGEVAGTWRRKEHLVTLQPWTHLTLGQREAVEAEAASLPLPGIERDVVVRWA